MRVKLPPLYFRIKDNGAAVYRVGTNDKFGRIEFTQIANIVVKSRKIRPNSGVILEEDEVEQMQKWMDHEENNQVSELADGLRRISREINLVCNSLSTVPKVNKDLQQAANRLLLSILDMQRELTDKIVRGRRNSEKS